MAPISIVIAQTTEDILAEAIAEGVRRESDAVLSPDWVVPARELSALLNGTDCRPDGVILIGREGDLNAYSKELLENQPALVVARIAIGSDSVHLDLRDIGLRELIRSIQALVRRQGACAGQRLTHYRAISDTCPETPGEIRLMEIHNSLGVMKNVRVWLDTVLHLHLQRSANSGNDIPGLSVSRTTIESLLLDCSGETDTAACAAFSAAESAWSVFMCALQEANPQDDPLASLCKGCGLTNLEIEAFLLCLAPELDSKYQRVFGFMNDDLGRRTASFGLVASILGEALPTRVALAKSQNLLNWRLVGSGGAAQPCADDPLRVDPPLVAWLLGNRAALLRDPQLAGVVRAEPWVGVRWLSDPADLQRAEMLCESLASERQGGAHWMALTGNDGSVWRALLEKVAGRLAIPLVRISLRALGGLDAAVLDERLVRLGRAVRLMGAIPVIDAADPAAGGAAEQALGRLVGIFDDVPQACVLIVPNIVHAVDALPHDDYRLMQRNTSALSPPVAAFAAASRAAGLALAKADYEQLASAYPLPLDGIDRAVRLAAARGASDRQSAEEQTARLGEACRTIACPELPRFAALLEPSFRLDEVVLPADRHQQIKDIVAHVLHARMVFESWGFGAQLPYGKGVAALFSGPSGTGKTMAARAIGHALQRSIFAVDLSRVVSKYIGETEKNLEAVFVEAERAGAILLFDEADALFGKRSEVKDAHDRYANIEIAYLLQRMEAFGGLAILTSNLGQNLDRAFTRRLRFIVDFPFPDAEAREKIWLQCLPPEAPLAEDHNIRYLARRIEMTGGNIRQITLRAAFAAAAEGGGVPISHRHIIKATRAELLKLGMPGLERELADEAV